MLYFKTLGIIPSRYASTRFPGKPLVDIAGKTMIQRVYEQASKSKFLSEIIVATDDERIYSHIKSFGGNVIMTNSNHPSGTDRCFEAYQKYGKIFDFVINIQGDEPFIQPEQIDLLASQLNPEIEIATLCKKITETDTLFNPNSPKVIFDTNNKAIFFSRLPIPYFRGKQNDEWILNHDYFKHIGIYAYRTDILEKLTKLSPSKLEIAESLEQLRWLENGNKIFVYKTEIETFGIDSPEDLEKIILKTN